MGKPTFKTIKDPQSVLDYKMDWGTAPWLPTTDTIASSTITADAGLTVDSSSFSDTIQTAWLSGGTDGLDYNVVFHIVTAENRTAERTLRVVVQDR